MAGIAEQNREIGEYLVAHQHNSISLPHGGLQLLLRCCQLLLCRRHVCISPSLLCSLSLHSSQAERAKLVMSLSAKRSSQKYAICRECQAILSA